jgi:hypothetical protein
VTRPPGDQVPAFEEGELAVFLFFPLSVVFYNLYSLLCSSHTAAKFILRLKPLVIL